MFTPNGTSRMVRMNQMPAILSDMQRAGYLAVWNKRYGETDPRLSGKADPRGSETLGEIHSTLSDLFKELDAIRLNANPSQVAKDAINSNSTGTPQMPTAMKQELGIMANRFQASRSLGTEQSRIYRFNRKLLEFLTTQKDNFRTLSNTDIPPGFQTYKGKVLSLHTQLQQAMVQATTGSGQSNEQELTTWLTSHREQIAQLKSYWLQA